MSILLKCDKCGKTATEPTMQKPDFNWCYLKRIDSAKVYHLCENCMTGFTWVFDEEESESEEN